MRISGLFLSYRSFLIGCLALAAACLSGSAVSGAAASAGIEPPVKTAPGIQQAGRSELEELLKTLEDPAERERLINQIRTLLEARDRIGKTATGPAVSPSGPALKESTQYGKLSQWAADLPKRTLERFHELPGLASRLKDLKHHLSDRENLAAFLQNVLGICLTLLLAFWLRYHMLRRMKTARERLRPAETPTWWVKMRRAFAELGIESLSIALLFIVAGVMSIFMGWENRSSLLLIFLLGMFSLYWLALSLVQRLASPEAPGVRVLPCGDRMAGYIVIWARRLVKYGIFAYTPIWVIEWAGLEGDVVQCLHMVYRFGWIALIGVLLFQLKDRVAQKIPRIKEGRTPYTSFMVKNLNSILPHIYPMLALLLLVILCISVLGYGDTARFLLARTGVSLVIIGMGAGVWYIFKLLLGKLFATGERIRKKFPGLEVMANRYITFLHTFIKALLTFFVALLVFQAWGVELLSLITRGMLAEVLGRIFVVALIIGISLFVIQVSQFIVAQLLAEKTDEQGRVISIGRRGKTFVPLLNNIVQYVTFFIAGVLILQQLGVNTGPILAGAGILGLAVGFGAQSLIKDILAGCFIILEDSISVGDVVVAKGTGGLVEAVNLRTIKLRDLAGNVHVIPNSNIDMITNMTKDYSRYVLDVGVSYREDVDEVIQVLKEIDDEMRKDPGYKHDILQPLEVLGVDDFGASQVTIRTRITTKPIKQWNVAREMRRRIKRRFDELGIEIPFPHMTLYIGDPKREAPQPLVIKIQGEDEGPAKEGKNPPGDPPSS